MTNVIYVRCWPGFMYVAFILDEYAQRIVAWNAATTKHTNLVPSVRDELQRRLVEVQTDTAPVTAIDRLLRLARSAK